MKENNIDTLIAEFNQQSDKARICLTDILNAVDRGCVPSHEKMADLEVNITDLRKKYDEVYSLVESSVSESELPILGSPVGQLADTFNSSVIRRIEKQVSHAKSVLQKFIEIRSAINEYTEALMRYQKEAENSIQQLNKDTFEKLSPEIEAAELFLTAMEHENIHSPEGIELMQQISANYPDIRITLGLAGKKYYYDDTPKALPSSSAEITDTADEEETVTDDTVLTDGNSAKLSAVNKVRIDRINASSFKKDIVKIGKTAKEIFTILPLFTNLGVLTKTHIYYFGVCMDCFSENDKVKEQVFSAVDLLAAKGYIAAFSLEDAKDTAYCLSNYCYGCMNKDSIAHLAIWSISYGTVKVAVNSEIKSETVRSTLANNNILMNYMLSQKKLLNHKDYVKIKKSVKWKNDHYQAAVIHNGNTYLTYVAAPYMDIGSIKEEYILISAGEDENIADSFSESCVRVFVIKDNAVYSCDPHKNIPEQLAEAFDKEQTEYEEALDSDEDKEQAEYDEGELPDLQQDTGEAPQNSGADSDAAALETDAVPEPVAAASSVAAAMSGNCATAVAEKPEFEAEEKEIEPPMPELNIQSKSPVIDDFSAYNLLQLDRTPSDDEFCEFIHSGLNKKVTDEKQLKAAMVQSVLFAKGAGLEPDRERSKHLSLQVRLATNLLLDDCSYSSECLSTAFANMEKEVPALTIAAYMYAMLTPAAAYDYALNMQTEIFFKI